MSGQEIPLTTVALDGPVQREASERLLMGSPRTLHPYGVEVELADEGRLFLFGFGAVVHLGPGAFSAPLRAEVERATGRTLLSGTEDTYTLALGTGPAHARPRVDWDRIALAEARPELVAAAALLLAQSAALERFEQKAEELQAEALAMARDLRDSGRPPRQTRALVRRIGHITAERLAMSSWFYLEDRPEQTWRDPGVAALYDALFENLEMEPRRAAMHHKLDEVESATRVVVDLAHGVRSHLLEWAIVLLIVLEVVLMVAGVAG